MPRLKIAAYAPDMPDTSEGSDTIHNVYPRTPDSYGAVGAPSVYSGALSARCQGAVAFIDSSGNVNLFAGDATKLYRLVSGTTAWTDVSKAATTYGTGSDAQWQYTYFNGSVIATNFGDAPQAFTLASSTNFIDLAAGAPKARYVAAVKNAFVVFGNTNDGVNGNMPQRVWWSAAGNATSFPTLGTTAAAQVQSSAVDLLGAGGWVQGIAADLANADAAVFQEYAVKRMTYVGPPDIFAFLPAENTQGTPAPYSIVAANGLAYYLAQDGFYVFDGGSSAPIGANKVDKTFSLDLDQSNIARVIGAADPINRMIWWAYPGAGNVGGNPNRLLGYNWQLQRWCLCDITSETIMRLLSIGYSLDALFTTLGFTIDALPAPLDSRVWTGGRLLLGLFDTSHKLNFLTGPNLAARVDTNEVQPIPDRRALLTMTRPLIDGGTTAAVSIGRRETLQASPAYTSPVSMNSMGACPVRASGRYVRGSITTSAGDNWTNISGLDVTVVPQGDR